MRAMAAAVTGTALLLLAAPGAAEDTGGELSGIVLQDVTGAELRLGDFAGDVVVISFWASYCKPCKTEMPFLQELHERYGGQGLRVIGLSLDTPDTEAGVVPFLERNRYTYINAVDRQSDAANVLNPRTVLPYLLIYDRSGRRVLARDGFTPGDRTGLEDTIRGLLEDGGETATATAAATATTTAAATDGELKGIVLQDVTGAELRLGDFAGNVVVISFWATYCKPCKTEMPFLQELHERYGGQGLRVIGLSLDTPDTEAGVVPFLERNRYTYINAVDRQSDAANVLNPRTILPYLLIYDRSGRRVLARDGFTPGDRAGLEETLKGLLEAPAVAVAAPPRAAGGIDWKGLARDFRWDLTETLYVEWHRDNHNNLAWDDDFVGLKNRLNLRLGTRGILLGGRFDAAHFFPVRQGIYPLDLGGAPRRFADLHPYDYNMEKIFLQLRGSSASLELGDFYVCQGRGITACVQKLDELAIDTTVRGAKGSMRTELVEATAFTGITNIVNVGDQAPSRLPDPSDWLSGAALTTRFIPFVNVGLHGSFLRDYVDFEELSRIYITRKHLWSVGGIVEAPSFLWGHASFVSEFDWFSHDEVVFGNPFTHQGGRGFAWYTSATGHVSLVGLLLELKWYEGLGGFGSMSADVSRSLGSYEVQRETVAYGNLPPLEEEGLFLRPGFYDNLGFRGRVDVTVPGTGMIWSVNYAHTDEIAGGGMKNGANDSWVRHVYGGVELRYDDVGVSGHAQGGWRRDRENAESIHDWSMWHVDGALGGPLWRIISLEGTGRFESYRQVPGSFEPDFMIAQAALTLNVAPWVSVAGMYEYSDQPPVVAPNHKHHLAAQVTYRFLPGSWLKVFFGSTRGGLKCSGGVCRVFPPFDGMRTELTVRF